MQGQQDAQRSIYGGGSAQGSSIGQPQEIRPTVAGTLEQALAMLGEAEHAAFAIAGHLLGPTPSGEGKQPAPVGVVSAASEVRNRAQRLVELLHAIQREIA